MNTGSIQDAKKEQIYRIFHSFCNPKKFNIVSISILILFRDQSNKGCKSLVQSLIWHLFLPKYPSVTKCTKMNMSEP